MVTQSHSLSNNVLRDAILTITACSVRSDKQILFILSESDSYRRRIIKGLLDEKYVRVNASDNLISLTKTGLNLLKEKNLSLYEYYMAVSNNHHPGSDDRHKEIFKKTSHVLAAMRSAEIAIGPEKPDYEFLSSSPGQRLSIKEFGPSFFLNKELKYKGQKQSRDQISRSIGILISHGLCAVTYNTLDSNLQFKRMAEKQAHIRIVGNIKSIYKDREFVETTHTIIFCRDEFVALNIFNTTSQDKKGRTNCFGDAIRDKSVLGTDILYVPANEHAKKCIVRLSKFGPKKIMETCFTEQEMAAAREAGQGDAIIPVTTKKGVKNLICFEFCSGNLSNLYRAVKLRQAGKFVGIVCLHWQSDFVRDVFRDVGVFRIRELVEEDFDNALERSEVVGTQIKKT